MNVVTRTSYTQGFTPECLLEVKPYGCASVLSPHVLWFMAMLYTLGQTAGKKKEGWGSLTLKLSSCMKPRHLYPRRGLTEWYTHVIDVIHIYLKGNLSFAAMHTKGIFLNNSSLVISKHPENQNILLCNFIYGNLECVIIISNRILLNKGLIIW